MGGNNPTGEKGIKEVAASVFPQNNKPAANNPVACSRRSNRLTCQRCRHHLGAACDGGIDRHTARSSSGDAQSRTSRAVRAAAIASGVGRSLDAASGSWFVIPLDCRVLGIACPCFFLVLASSSLLASCFSGGHRPASDTRNPFAVVQGPVVRLAQASATVIGQTQPTGSPVALDRDRCRIRAWRTAPGRHTGHVRTRR